MGCGNQIKLKSQKKILFLSLRTKVVGSFCQSTHTQKQTHTEFFLLLIQIVNSEGFVSVSFSQPNKNDDENVC
jgi:hypothetical protein